MGNRKNLSQHEGDRQRPPLLINTFLQKGGCVTTESVLMRLSQRLIMRVSKLLRGQSEIWDGALFGALFFG